MNPIRTAAADVVYKLPGGTDENDLWVETDEVAGATILTSTWELDDQERAAIAAGARVELLVWGGGHPPVALRVAAA